MAGMLSSASGAQQWVYHEKQAAALCGVHAVNSLLQGPFFDAGRFSEIAQQLDAQERALMFSEGTETPDAIRFAAAESVNVDASGNFSVAVLRVAVRQHSGLGLTRWQPQQQQGGDGCDGRDPNSTAVGFVFNLADHWFTLRPVFGVWWNLNSTLPRPSRVGPAYLSAFLAQMAMSGYTIFEVTGGVLPPPVQPGGGGTGPGALVRQPSWGSPLNWHTLAELFNPPPAIASAQPSSSSSSSAGSRVMSEEEQMNAAIAASLADSVESTHSEGAVVGTIVEPSSSSIDDGDGEEDEDLQAALLMSVRDS
jgi:hypothetical protein